MFLRNRMLSEVRGTRDKRLKTLLAVAAEFYCSKLMTSRMVHNIHISIELKKNLEEDGFCCIEEYNNSGKPREFTIELDKGLNEKTLLTVLAHECVHVKQYAMGELDDNLSVWRGRKVNSDKVPYWEHPWEIEAYGRERGLYVQFIEKHNLQKLHQQPLK